MQSTCNKKGVLSLIVLRTTALADLALGFLSDFSPTIPPHSKAPTLLFLKHHRNISALEVHNVSSLCLEWSSPIHEVYSPLHYFLQTSAQTPCSLTVLSWPSNWNISPLFFFMSLIATWGVTDLFTLCFMSLECKVAQERGFICSLLLPSV